MQNFGQVFMSSTNEEQIDIDYFIEPRTPRQDLSKLQTDLIMDEDNIIFDCFLNSQQETQNQLEGLNTQPNLQRDRLTLNSQNANQNIQDDHIIIQEVLDINQIQTQYRQPHPEINEEMCSSSSTEAQTENSTHTLRLEIFIDFLSLTNSNLSGSDSERDESWRTYSRRRQKNCLMELMDGQHWTKFFLPNAKKILLAFLREQFGAEYVEEVKRRLTILTRRGTNREEAEPRVKKGTSREEIKNLLCLPELRQVWEKFFRTGYFYRATMLGKASMGSKMVSVKFGFRLYQVFRTGQFPYIAGPPNRSETRQ